jgi:hypothetical protein
MNLSKLQKLLPMPSFLLHSAHFVLKSPMAVSTHPLVFPLPPPSFAKHPGAHRSNQIPSVLYTEPQKRPLQGLPSSLADAVNLTHCICHC